MHFVESAIIVDGTHLELASGKLIQQKIKLNASHKALAGATRPKLPLGLF